ncbi:MAG: hypothetical protein QE265_07835 [Rhodoferax sp.]|nr:hypothetical protein [Rhodoferax sp.]
MGRIWVMVVIASAAAWYYFVGGAKLDEALIRRFYESGSHATLSRDPEALCKLYSDKLELTQETLMMGQTRSQRMNKQETCESQRQSFKYFEEIGNKVDGILTIEYDYQIEDIVIAPDRKSARVHLSSTLKMGENLMQFRSLGTDVLRREWGVVKVVKQDVVTRVRFDPAAIADPAKYLQAH